MRFVVILSAFVLTACEPNVDEILRAVDDDINAAIASIPTATPQPTATPNTDSILAELDARIEAAIASIPTATPQPTATPVTFPPTPTPLPLFLFGLLTPTPTPLALAPTPTPLVPVGTPTPTTRSQDLGSGLILTIDPFQPVAGQPIYFSLQGLEPYGSVDVTVLDGTGNAVDWTSKDGTFVSAGTESQERLKTRTLYADATGLASWARLNILDPEGHWTIRLSVESKTYTAAYDVLPAQLSTSLTSDLGVTMRRFSGSRSDVYASAGVPLSIALDMSALVAILSDRLRPWLDTTSLQIPNVYLFSDSDMLRSALLATGGSVLGWEGGIYRRSGPYRGVYVTLHSFKGDTIQLLLHEYVHLVVAELGAGPAVPAWLNEGLASYLDIELGQRLGAPLSSRREAFLDADEAKAALRDDSLLSLNDLVSQREWNGQREDLVSLQYSQAYMAVRYLLERFGAASAGLILTELKTGQSFESAFQRVTGSAVSEFEAAWLAWLANWHDGTREEIRTYLAAADGLLDRIRDISEDRGSWLAANPGSFASRVLVQSGFVERATSIENEGKLLLAPFPVTGAHLEMVDFMSFYAS